jgi:hypothetical protein
MFRLITKTLPEGLGKFKGGFKGNGFRANGKHTGNEAVSGLEHSAI